MWESEKGIQAAVASFLCLCGEWLFDGRKKRGRPSRQKAAGHKKAAAAKNTWQPVVMGNDGTLLDMTFLACRLRKKRQARRGGALWQWQKKNPGSKISIRDSPFYPQKCQVRRRPRSRFLLRSGRSSDSRFILLVASSRSKTISDMVRRSSSVTAAGPSPIFTEFPLKFCYEHLSTRKLNQV